MEKIAPDRSKEREAMVERQIAGRGIGDAQLHAAMRDVPRELFIDPSLSSHAYDDCPLPIESGQTISQPAIVAQMIEAAEIAPGDHVLEVGAGSGYAAAVMGRMGAKVHAIERHQDLAELARARIGRLGLSGVSIIHGDGTRGLESRAPYDAILVAARSDEVPRALVEQLAPGGRLIIPVGGESVQQLRRYAKLRDGTLTKQDLGPVRFVPLISDPDRDDATSLGERIARAAIALPAIGDDDFAAAFDRYGDRRVVMLGEASHGTSEFYTARAAITRRLIERHGFTHVAAEADWPDAATVDAYANGREPERGFTPFARFPTWMWRNREFARFVDWMKRHNERADAARRIGFYGLDLYNLNASIAAVIGYLDDVDPEAAAIARERYGCLQPWVSEPATYGRFALSRGYAPCEDDVVAMLSDMLRRSLNAATADGGALADAQGNARLVANAEAYYRAMYYGSAESWNLRDSHMFETLSSLLDDPAAKVVVWAHNSHIGDACATEMGQVRGEHNIGQLAREALGDAVALIGFGTDRGTVAAADDWDTPMKVKTVRPSLAESHERAMVESGGECFMLPLGEDCDESLAEALETPRLERFIGVIYRPETERWSHYSECRLDQQFDAYVWFEETSAVTPLPAPTPESDRSSDDLWPSGL